MNETLIRLAAVVQLTVLIACGLGWHLAHRDHIPRPAWLLGWVYGYVIALVAVAIVVNALDTAPVTPGLRACVVLLVPATLAALALTVRQVRAGAGSKES